MVSCAVDFGNQGVEAFSFSRGNSIQFFKKLVFQPDGGLVGVGYANGNFAHFLLGRGEDYLFLRKASIDTTVAGPLAACLGASSSS